MPNPRLAYFDAEQYVQRVRLLPFQFLREQNWTYPQPLPILIHPPAQPVGKLPGFVHINPLEDHS